MAAGSFNNMHLICIGHCDLLMVGRNFIVGNEKNRHDGSTERCSRLMDVDQ